jgi:DNA repair protein SbcD/Mre11
MREAGEKGATLVTVRDGRIDEVEHVQLDVVRWVSLDVNLTGTISQDGLAGLLNERLENAVIAADGRLVVARIVLSGATKLHHALKTNADHWLDSEIERARLDLDKLWLEQVIVETRAAGDHGRAESDALSEIGRTIEALRGSAQDRESLQAQIREVVEKLVPSLGEFVGQGPDGEAADPDALLDSVLDDARDLLLGRLEGMS